MNVSDLITADSSPTADGGYIALPPRDFRLRMLANSWSPVPAIGKRVLLQGWTEFCRRAPTNKEIEEWSTDHPDWSNTGAACGGVIGIDLDIDDENLAGVIESLAKKLLGSTPLKRIGRAPRAMLVYRADEMIRSTTVKGETGAGVDILGDGRQFICFGIHPQTGKPYKWPGASPLDTAVATLPRVNAEQVDRFLVEVRTRIAPNSGPRPARVVANAEATSPALDDVFSRYGWRDGASDYAGYGAAALAAEVAAVRNTGPGDQSNQLNCSSFSLGQLVGVRVLDRALVERELRGATRGWLNDPSREPWSRAQIDKVISRGIGDGERNPRDLPAPGSEYAGTGEVSDTASVEKVALAKNGVSGVAWPEPTLFKTSHPAPPFPIESLPRAVAAFCHDEAERMQAPVDLLGTTALVTLAGLIGKNAVMRPKRLDDWEESPCLWLMLIQPPGSMKSAAIARAVAPLRRIEARLSEDQKLATAGWVKKKMEADQRAKAHDSACKALLKKNPSAQLPEPPPSAPEEPSSPRVITQDATIEKLADMIATSRGLSLVRDELSGFMLNMSRYNAGSDRQFYLECYSGGDYAVDRVGRPGLLVKDLFLNILGGIQPEVAMQLFAATGKANDGFFDRFGLIAFPEPRADWRHVDREPDFDARRLYNDICDRLFNADWRRLLKGSGEDDDPRSKPYARFDDEAQPIFNEWLSEHMRTLQTMQDDPIGGLLGKGRGLLVRLVLVIHLASWAGGEETCADTVSAKSLTRAIVLFEDYLVPMWRRTLATFGRVAEDEGARRIAKYLLDNQVGFIRSADITKKNWSGLKDSRAVHAAFEVLLAHDWLAEPHRSPGARGRPSARYDVNPLVHDLFVTSDV
jgi:hypothetical protein